MRLHQQLNERAEEILALFEQGELGEVELIQRLRDETRSNIFFKFFIERLLRIAYEQHKVVASKGLLKHYLLSEVREDTSFSFVGFQPKSQDALEIDGPNKIKKGLFFKIIEQLGLERTTHAYTAYLLLHADEFDGEEYLQPDDKQYKNLNTVVETLFEEFDEKLGSEAKIITF